MTRIAIAVKTTEGGRWIIPQIVEARRRGVHVIVLIPNGPGRLVDLLDERFADDTEVELIRAPVEFGASGLGGTVRDLWILRRALKKLRLDAVLYHLYATALMFRFATFGSRLRRVHMVAGPLYLESAKIRLVERILAHLDTVIICGSRYTFDKYRALGMAASRLETIPYGVDLRAFEPPSTAERAASRRQLGYASGDFVAVMIAYVYAPKELVFAGRGIKGHDDLLQAWSVFATRHPDARLLLVGGGFDEDGEKYRKSMIDSLDRSLQSSNIRWLDSVDDVRTAYSVADVSVSPSLSDNHGAALEASSMGVACVVSDAGALPEAVENDSGWIHKAGSAESLLEALEGAYATAKSGKLEQVSRNARGLMERNFSQQESARRAIDVVLDTASDNDRSKHAKRPTITYFSEARLQTDADGATVSSDSMLAGLKWQRTLAGIDGLRLAARVNEDRCGTGREVVGEVVRLPYYIGLRQMAGQFRKIRTTIDRAVADSDAVCVKLPGIIGTIASSSAARQGKPIAAEVVGDIGEVLRAGIGSRFGALLAPFAVAMTRRAVKRADSVRYVTRRALQDRYPAKRQAVQIAHTDVVIEDTLLARSREAISGGLIVAVGSQEQPYKGHQFLIRALPRVLEVRHSARLVLIGDGRYQSQLKDLVRRLHLEQQVDFAGFISDRETLQGYLDSAEVFALPSLTEGLPRALIEAMSRGLPCVASSVGGVPELLSAEVTCAPGDAADLARKLSRILTDAEFRDEQSSRNRLVASEYSQTNMDHSRRSWRNAVGALTARTAGSLEIT